MRSRPVLASLVLAICLTAAWSAGALGADSRPDAGPVPFHSRILEVSRAPHAAAIMRQAALTYMPHMSARDRDRDFLQKVALVKQLLGVGRLVDLRHQTLNLLLPGQEVSWEDLRGHRRSQTSSRRSLRHMAST